MPGYFKTLGVPLRSGRDFTTADTRNAPAVGIIDERLARKYWPGQDPIGKRFKGGDDWTTVVGVVGDVHHQGLDVPIREHFFRPYPQAGWPVMSIVVRTTHAPAIRTDSATAIAASASR